MGFLSSILVNVAATAISSITSFVLGKATANNEKEKKEVLEFVQKTESDLQSRYEQILELGQQVVDSLRSCSGSDPKVSNVITELQSALDHATSRRQLMTNLFRSCYENIPDIQEFARLSQDAIRFVSRQAQELEEAMKKAARELVSCGNPLLQEAIGKLERIVGRH